MNTFSLRIYRLDLPENLKKDGTISKRAKTEKGSSIEYLREGEHSSFKIAQLDAFGYRGYRSGYVDSNIIMEDGSGNPCVAFYDMNGITLGFSRLLKEYNENR